MAPRISVLRRPVFKSTTATSDSLGPANHVPRGLTEASTPRPSGSNEVNVKYELAMYAEPSRLVGSPPADDTRTRWPPWPKRIVSSLPQLALPAENGVLRRMVI